MELSLQNLDNEYNDIKLKMSDILKKNLITKEEIDKLEGADLREFSELNKQLFKINEKIFHEFMKKKNI